MIRNVAEVKPRSFDPHRLKELALHASEHCYGPQDVMLYALSLGLGRNPLNAAHLRFVFEQNLQVLPTFGSILGRVARWTHHPDAGIDHRGCVHGSHQLTLHRLLDTSGSVRAQWQVREVVDRGPGKGAVIVSETTIHDTNTERLVATIVDTVLCRFDGGKGGSGNTLPQLRHLPQRKPDAIVDQPSLPQAALLYRLNGDDNPLHCDPVYAAAAGFDGPILHGLATYGISGIALVETVCGGDPTRIRSIGCRFVAPAYPGETFRTEIWYEGGTAYFRTTAVEREIVVLSNGAAEIVN